MKKTDMFSTPASTVIGGGFTFHAAKVIGVNQESIRVDGTIIGEVEIDGVLNLGPKGYIEGNIKAHSVRIAGRVKGNIFCHHTAHLASTAQVLGDILTSSLVVDNGAALHGRCQTHIIPKTNIEEV